MRRTLGTPLLLIVVAFPLFSQTPAITTVRNPHGDPARLAPSVLVEVRYTPAWVEFLPDRDSIRIGGRTVTVLLDDSSPGLLTVYVPDDVPTGAANFVLTMGGASSAPFPITLADYAPGLSFIQPVSGTPLPYSCSGNTAPPGELVTT